MVRSAAVLTALILQCGALGPTSLAQTPDSASATSWTGKRTPIVLQLPPGWSGGETTKAGNDTVEKPFKSSPTGYLSQCVISRIDTAPKPGVAPRTQAEVNEAFKFVRLDTWLELMEHQGWKNLSWIEGLPRRIVDGKVVIVGQARERVKSIEINHQLAVAFTPGNTYLMDCMSPGTTWPPDSDEPRDKAFAEFEALVDNMRIPD